MSLTRSIPNGGATHGRSTIRRIGEVAGGGAQPAADAPGHVGAGWSGGRDRGGTARRCAGSAPGIRRAAAAGRMCAYLRWDDVRREWLRGDMRVPPRTRLHRGNGTLRMALLWQRSVQRGLPLRSGEQCLRIQSSWRCVQRGRRLPVRHVLRANRVRLRGVHGPVSQRLRSQRLPKMAGGFQTCNLGNSLIRGRALLDPSSTNTRSSLSWMIVVSMP